jgi:hypothetical protein
MKYSAISLYPLYIHHHEPPPEFWALLILSAASPGTMSGPAHNTAVRKRCNEMSQTQAHLHMTYRFDTPEKSSLHFDSSIWHHFCNPPFVATAF